MKSNSFFRISALLLASTLPLAHAAQDPVTKVHVLTADFLKIKAVPSTRTVAIEPETFVRQAALNSNMIVVLGNLATKRSKNENVRHFAQRLVDTHSGWFDRLNTLASSRHVLLPNEMTPEEIRVTDHLTELVDLDFDQDYLWHMISTLRKSQERLASASNSSDVELKSFATENLPKVREQLAEATKLGQAMLKTGEAGYVKSKAYPDPNAKGEPAPASDSTDETTPSTPAVPDQPDEKGNPNDEPLPQGQQ